MCLSVDCPSVTLFANLFYSIVLSNCFIPLQTDSQKVVDGFPYYAGIETQIRLHFEATSYDTPSVLRTCRKYQEIQREEVRTSFFLTCACMHAGANRWGGRGFSSLHTHAHRNRGFIYARSQAEIDPARKLITLAWNTDGIPFCKSSNKSAHITSSYIIESNQSPFLLAVLVGKKPSSEYYQPIIDELNQLATAGMVIDGQAYIVRTLFTAVRMDGRYEGAATHPW